MQTYSTPHLRAYRRAARARTAQPGSTPGKRLFAAMLSVALCCGLVPVVPAWGDEAAAGTATPTEGAPDQAAADAAAGDNDSATDGTATTPTPAPEGADAATGDAADSTADGAQAAETAPTPAQAAPTVAAPAAESQPGTTENPDEGTPVADNPDESTAVGKAVDQYFPTDKKATAKLLKKLTARFSAKGDDGVLSADTVNAAAALNALGKGADIDADGLIKSFAKAEKKAEDGLTLGQYGRFIMALTAAGIDCTKAQIGGKTRNLVVEMEKLTADADPTVEEAVYLLPVYGNDNYRNISGTTPEGLIEIILDAQGEDGFFWADEKAETYSIPLTSQALLALVPYLDDELVDKKVSDEVADAVAAASEALYDAQLIDGSWPADGVALEGNIPATAYATTALVALGADPAKDLKTSNDSTPLGYLTAHADKALDGYTDAEGVAKKDEPVVAATVLMALAANKGYIEAKDAFDVYDVREVKRPEAAAAKAKTTPTRSPSSSTHRSTTPTKTIPQSGDELPWTMAFTGAAAALSLAAAVLARRRLTE